MSSKKILMVAGEASGDLHGAHLLEAIHRIDPQVHVYGVGGEGLARQGMEILYPSSSLAVVGITEVLFKLGPILSALRGLKRVLDRRRPDLVVLIDFPDFNLRLARMSHRRGIPVLYYVSPQVWAWRTGRIRQIARWVKKMIVLFPFEVPFYQKAGVEVEWVGHPLLDIVNPSLESGEAFRRFGLDPGRRTIALLPGSRTHEIERLLPVLLAAARLLQREIPDLQFVIPVAPGISGEELSARTRTVPVPVTLVQGYPYEVMNLAELLITASGTATLEATVLKKPMVIVYRVSFFSSLVGRLLIKVKYIGLPNLVAERKIVPELIQEEASPERVAAEALKILRDAELRRKMAGEMEEACRRLGEPGAARRAAGIVCSLLDEMKV
jgi:lipid-A-disaccharide synthase